MFLLDAKVVMEEIKEYIIACLLTISQPNLDNEYKLKYVDDELMKALKIIDNYSNPNPNQ